MNFPIVGIAIENGTPSKNDFRADVRVLELSVLGDLDHPSVCAIVLEHVHQTTPRKYPFDDVAASDGRIEGHALIPCSEKPGSTKLMWPDGEVAMTGHIEYNVHAEEENSDWVYHIDHIARAPRIATFEPPASFTWQTSEPTTRPSASKRQESALGAPLNRKHAFPLSETAYMRHGAAGIIGPERRWILAAPVNSGGSGGAFAIAIFAMENHSIRFVQEIRTDTRARVVAIRNGALIARTSHYLPGEPPCCPSATNTLVYGDPHGYVELLRSWWTPNHSATHDGPLQR
jgi:hypothetical protein